MRRGSNEMMNSRRKIRWGAIVLALVLSFLSAGTARAWSVGFTCWPWGNAVKWWQFGTLQVPVQRDSCTIGGTSTASSALVDAASAWSAVTGFALINLTWTGFGSGCTQSLGDGRNHIKLVPSNQLPPNYIGMTSCAWGTCIASPAFFDECDVKLDNSLTYQAINEAFPAGIQGNDTGRALALHELGHFYGLGHYEDLDVMRASQPNPLGGGNTVPPYADDAYGVRALYSNNRATLPNVFASAQRLQSGSIVPTNLFYTVSMCRGQAIPITYSVVNNGRLDAANVGFKIYLGTDINSTSGVDLLNTNAYSPAFSYFTATSTLTVPNTVGNGYWFILWKIDSNNQLGEFNESDNTVHSAMSIQISC